MFFKLSLSIIRLTGITSFILATKESKETLLVNLHLNLRKNKFNTFEKISFFRYSDVQNSFSPKALK